MPETAHHAATCNDGHRRQKVLYLCDWLPPDYGAVGQYSLLFARELAESGHDVVLAGLSSTATSDTLETIGTGRLRQMRLRAAPYDKTALLRRMLWTFGMNTQLLWHVRRQIRTTDTILFTGSPPFLLHWLVPLNLFLRKELVYRITDFHPECLIAQRGSAGPMLRLLLWLTVFWRRRVDAFEVLGYDQMERLTEIGISRERIRLKRDPSPVTIPPATAPLPRPGAADGKLLMLYSGNWGVAHDTHTFLAAYRKHHRDGSGRFVLWLNAVGAAVESVEAELNAYDLPYVRGTPVPLADLARLLVTPDAHLITLSDAFVGFVLPSKVHGCIESQRSILFVGSSRSDVHRLCAEHTRAPYRRVDVGDVEGCAQALEALADAVSERMNDPTPNRRGGDALATANGNGE